MKHGDERKGVFHIIGTEQFVIDELCDLLFKIKYNKRADLSFCFIIKQIINTSQLNY